MTKTLDYHLEVLIAKIIDGLDVDAILKCGGEGGKPGPCPENKPPTTNQRSRSGGDKDKDRRRGQGRPSRNEEKQHLVRLGDCLGLARAGLDASVQNEQISEGRAAECHEFLGDVMGALPPRCVERIHRHVVAFNWFETVAGVDAFDRETDADAPGGTAGFVMWPDDGPPGRATVVLDGPDDEVYFHELTHAIDGPPLREGEDGPGQALSNTAEWQRAFRAERGLYSNDAYPTQNAAEWMAALATVAWTAPRRWEIISRRLPLSRAFLEREVLR